jgi:aromatic-L-amino-acid/L-tryptophan decarboxylase
VTDRTAGGDLELDPEQIAGLTDMDPEAFRDAGHAVVDLLADYLVNVERYAVFPDVEPGQVRPLFPASPPEAPERIEAILADYSKLVEPNVTHWQHPGFMAYFATTASGPGILGELLTAGIGSNAMLWRTSPAATELEEVVVDWLRHALGLPEAFDGLLTDSASISSLTALAAAREVAGLGGSTHGLSTWQGALPRIYASAEAHSSIDKAAMTLGIGRESVVRIRTNDRFEMEPSSLAESIASDRAAGNMPIAIVATIGTTSSTAVDPVASVADIAEREKLWLHVDAAYAGAVAIIPGRRGPFEGWQRADSIVVNPHKWLFTPLDASLLLTRRMPALRDAFSLLPEYLRTLDREAPVRDYNQYIPQLGRRFRALKLWVLLRWFGLEGLRRRIERHIELAQAFAGWIDVDPDWERLAPVPFSTVCFRFRPAGLTGREADSEVASRLDAANERLMDAVNRTGEVFLSHARLGGTFTIRVAIGNLRTEARHVERAWELLRREATAIDV